MSNYQPAEWLDSASLRSNGPNTHAPAHPGVWQGRDNGQNNNQQYPAGYSSSYNPYYAPDFASDNNPNIDTRKPVEEKAWIDGRGRRCRIICEPNYNHPPNLKRIANSLLGKNINQAQRIYPNVRVVVRDGVQLPITKEYNTNRINVETRNGIINKIVGFY